MSLLANLKTEEEIQEDVDSIGNSGPVESGLYPASVAMAYLNIAKSGAVGLVLHLKTQIGKEIKGTLWMQSGDAKGNRNYYVDKQSGAKKYLPGFSLANGLSLLTVGKEISELTTEEKVIGIYNYDEGKELPTKVEVLTDLLNQDVLVGVQRQIMNKQVKNDDGVYVDSPDGATRTENEIDKFFCAKDSHLRMTVAEIKGGATEEAFASTWEAKWKGVDRDRVRPVKGASAGTPASGFGSGNSAAKPASLFAAS